MLPLGDTFRLFLQILNNIGGRWIIYFFFIFGHWFLLQGIFFKHVTEFQELSLELHEYVITIKDDCLITLQESFC